MTDTTTLLARRNRARGAGAPLFYEHPLHIVRGEGCHLYAEAERRAPMKLCHPIGGTRSSWATASAADIVTCPCPGASPALISRTTNR